MAKEVPYFYDRQVRRYIQQFIRLFSGFSVQMGVNDDTRLPIYQQTPVRYGDISRMAAHIQRENSENITNTVPFISCYVNSIDMWPERRVHQEHVDKVQVFEKKFDNATGSYTNQIGNTYTIERYMPVPYKLTMNVDIWTSNTDQKLQLFEQIGVLFNPTLNIHTSNAPFDWSAFSYVELTNTVWSSRQVGTGIDDIVDVMTLTFELPILINPPAKVKQQKIIHTIINQLYNFDQNENDLELFGANLPFNNETLQYTVVTLENMKLRFENDKAYLLNVSGSDINNETGEKYNWAEYLKGYGELRDGISQLRLRKSNAPGDKEGDIIGRLFVDESDPNAITVEIDLDTLPTNTLPNITGILNPQKNRPGDGVVPNPSVGDRYLITQDLPLSPYWNNLTAKKNDILQYNGAAWMVVFQADSVTSYHFVTNNASQDQLEWNGQEWFNSYEGIYKAGYWRLYL